MYKSNFRFVLYWLYDEGALGLIPNSILWSSQQNSVYFLNNNKNNNQ